MKIYEIIEETKIPTSKELKSLLKKKGYTFSQGGDHERYHAPDGSHHISMPRGPKPLSIGLAKSVMKQAGITDRDF